MTIPEGPAMRIGEEAHGLSNLVVVDHPLLLHKVSLLRDRQTPRKRFKELVDEVALLLAYEVLSDLDTVEYRLDTPLESTVGERIEGDLVTLVPVLRAGLGMVEGFRRLLPTLRVGHIGLERKHESLQPVDYYFKIPPSPEDQWFVVTDPMLATGGSAAAALDYLKESGARSLRLVCITAAPEGVRRLEQDHPDVRVFTAALDRELNDRGYILPGLGDAGDRLFGT